MRLCMWTNRWSKTTLFPVYSWELNKVVQEDRQTDTDDTRLPTREFNEVKQDDRQIMQDYLPESSTKLCMWTNSWSKTTLFPVYSWELNKVVQEDRQTDRQMMQDYLHETSMKLWKRTDRHVYRQILQDYLPESSKKLCKRTDRHTDR